MDKKKEQALTWCNYSTQLIIPLNPSIEEWLICPWFSDNHIKMCIEEDPKSLIVTKKIVKATYLICFGMVLNLFLIIIYLEVCSYSMVHIVLIVTPYLSFLWWNKSS